MRADGWSMLEESCGEMKIGELPQVLRGLVRAERPVVKREMKVEGEEVKMDVPGGEESKPSTSTRDSSPITQSLGNRKYIYKCPFCDFTPSTSKSVVDCHIRREHTKEPLFCMLCDFSTYSSDYLGQHEKKHSREERERDYWKLKK